MSDSDAGVSIQHVPSLNCFQAVLGGKVVGRIDYARHDEVVAVPHTEVDPDFGGRGIASDLTRTLVQWAQDQGLSIDARCSYVAGWLRKHPEAIQSTDQLIADEAR